WSSYCLISGRLLPSDIRYMIAEMDTSAESNPELESFREQWRAEVRSRHPAPAGSSSQPSAATVGPSAHRRGSLGTADAPRKPPPPPTKRPPVQDHDDDYTQPRSFDEAPAAGTASLVRTQAGPSTTDEPMSALDHYERAVEKEAAGNLGD